MKENIQINTNMLVNYAHGLLEPELASYIKHSLEKDELLKKEYAGLIALMQDYPNEDVEDLIEKISNLAEVEKHTPILISYKKWYAAAASILIFISVGWWISNMQHNSTQVCLSLSEVLQKENKYIPQVRDIPNDTSRWMIEFNQDHFNESIKILTASSENLKPIENYYLALAFLYNSPPNYKESSLQFNAYLNSGAMALQSKCHLYLGAIALKQNNLTEAKSQLTKVSQEDKNQADFLLREIK